MPLISSGISSKRSSPDWCDKESLACCFLILGGLTGSLLCDFPATREGIFWPKLEESSFCIWLFPALLLLFQQSILLLVCQFIFLALIARVFRFKNGFVVFCSSYCSCTTGDFAGSLLIPRTLPSTFGDPVYFYFSSLTTFPSFRREEFWVGFLSSS